MSLFVVVEQPGPTWVLPSVISVAIVDATDEQAAVDAAFPVRRFSDGATLLALPLEGARTFSHTVAVTNTALEPVEPLDPAVAEFTFAPPNPARGATVNFDASASTGAGGIASWAWDFGDGSTGTGEQAAYQYKGKGSYIVALTVTDAAGQTASQSQTVTVA